MARISKPTPDNRAEALAYWWKFLGNTGEKAESIEHDKFMLQYGIDRNDWRSVGSAESIAISRMQVAEYQRWHGLPEAEASLRLAFASFYWAVEFECVVRAAEKMADNISYDGFWDMLKWQGIAAACSEAWFVEWVALFLQRYLKKEVAREHMLTLDEQGRQFLALLQEIVTNKQWPGEVSAADFGAFAPLFNTANNPEKFKQTLIDFCDYRLAQTYGYPGINADKKRKRGKEWSIYEEDIFLSSVWPLELFILQYGYEKATGKSLSLDAPHPLLQSNLMRLPFPKLTPLVEDETNEKIKAFAKHLYGAAWQPQLA